MRNKRALNVVVSSVTFKTKSEIYFLDVFKVKCAKKVLFKQKNVEHENNTRGGTHASSFIGCSKCPRKTGVNLICHIQKMGPILYLVYSILCIRYEMYLYNKGRYYTCRVVL